MPGGPVDLGADVVLRDKNLNLLPILLALLEEESVVGAAKRVHLSQPAVSGALARLRDEFDDPLLVRVGRQMRRTSRADRLLPQIKQSCAELERLFDFGVFDPARAESSFVLAAPDHLALPLARELLPLLAAEAPGIEVRIVDAPNDLPRYLHAGNIDLAVAGDFGVWSDVSYEPVIRERFVAAMSSEHPLAGLDTLEPGQLESYVRVSRMPRPLADRSAKPIATGIPVLDLQTQINVEQFVTAILLVVGTRLVMPAPEMLVDTLASYLPIVGVPFDQDYSVEAGVFWAPFQDDSPEIAWLRSVIARCLRAADA
ncbi:MAG: LysR family transcriptional regulator [Ilumatobacter sp.]